MITGEDFVRTITWIDTDGVTPVSLEGYSASLIIENGSGLLLTVTETASENGSALTLGGIAGTISLYIAAADLAIISTNCRYRLLLTSPAGIKMALLYGLLAIAGTG